MDRDFQYDKKDVAARVKTIRESLRMSQSQFAELLGYGTDTISKLERGLRGISGEMTAAISLRTGISSDYILYGKEANSVSINIREQVRELLQESIKLLDQK